MDRYAIIMSVEEYSHFTPTKFTHADNDLVFNTLTQKCDYAEQHTIVFKLSPEDTKAPTDILSGIKRMVSNSNTGDSVLFYFAGHGHFQDDTAYLILPDTQPGAYETTALKLEYISKELRVSNRSCFRIFDACHSGIDVRDGEKKLDSISFIRAVNHTATGWVTLAACKDDEYSIPDPKIGQGLFTYYLCEEISSYEPDKPIYPEILKVNIAEKVYQHSNSIGYPQTTTLNGSISGNISIATRRVDITIPGSKKIEAEDTDLKEKISNLMEFKNVISNEYLEKVLKIMTDQCFSDFKNVMTLYSNISLENKIRADDIPEEMQPFIVDFSNKTGIQPRHDLVRWVEKYDDPNDIYSRLKPVVFSPKKIKAIHYYINQPVSMPNSAKIITLKGDGRCLPDVKILLYLIPLQITGCMLVSLFNYGWRRSSEDIKLIKNYYQIIKPDDSPKRIQEIGPFASQSSVPLITDIVEKRVALLERELKA